MGRVEAYRYSLPEQVGARPFVEVLPAGPDQPAFKNFPWAFERSMHEAWAYQFTPRLSPVELAKQAEERRQKMLGEEIIDAQPAYVLANIKIPTQTQKDPSVVRDFAAGVGKSKTAGREGEPRLADISDIYVDPVYQNHGVGTAIYRSLLDGFHSDEQLVAYEMAKNQRTIELLHRLNFRERKRWKVEQFGQKLDQVYFRGMLVGDMVELIEAKSPWLKDREHY